MHVKTFLTARGALSSREKPLLMGILNLTPDSFYIGSRVSADGAVSRALKMEADGADLLDVGACSTRPGGDIADEETELCRLKEALPAILSAVKVPVSVDTFRPAVAAFALEMGAAVINDVSGVFQPEMASLVRASGAGYIVMHAGPSGSKTADVVDYPNGVAADVQAFFDRMLDRLLSAGLDLRRICLDPGFGFAKTDAQNLALLRALPDLDTHGAALLVALSRKRFIGAMSDGLAADGRLPGTLSADLFAAASGADILRVHDVKEHSALFSGFTRG
ncbi:MAG: dihydropteroate synthase [Clostridia bacterium]|nr:dihydropteroate synthase [Clostridia bacterium]